MFLTFLFIRYSRRILNYLEIITLFDPTHMIRMTYPIAINMETSRIDHECYLEKEFTELILMNNIILMVNRVDPCHSYVFGPLTLRHQRHLMDV